MTEVDIVSAGGGLPAVIGYRPGPAIGHALRKLLDEVVRRPELNTKEQLLARAKELPR